MEAYYKDGRGRYGTGESYDWFDQYEDQEVEFRTSSDGLWTYIEINEGMEILRYNGNAIHVVVPQAVDGITVIALNSIFDGFYEMKSAVIPEGVTSLVGAFYGCEGIENVILPDSLVDMTYAFNCCYSLKQLAIPSGVRNFSWAFGGTRLERLVLPQGAEDISYIFSGSEFLKDVQIPGSLTSTYEAFCGCEALSRVVIEDGLRSIDKWAFYHCPSLTELTIPESVLHIAEKSVGFMEIRAYTDARKNAYQIKGEQLVPGFVIKGARGSAAERYAYENSIEFVSLL